MKKIEKIRKSILRNQRKLLGKGILIPTIIYGVLLPSLYLMALLSPPVLSVLFILLVLLLTIGLILELHDRMVRDRKFRVDGWFGFCKQCKKWSFRIVKTRCEVCDASVRSK